MSSEKMSDLFQQGAQTAKSFRVNVRSLIRLRTLRTRLIAWYTLLIFTLFSLLAGASYFILEFTLQNDIQVSMDRENAIVRTSLAPQIANAVTWPNTIKIPSVDAYIEQGVTVTLIDTQHDITYHSPSNHPIDLPNTLINAGLTGQSSVTEYTIKGDKLRISTMPIRGLNGTIIGAVFITVSLRPMDAILFILRLSIFVAMIPLAFFSIGGGIFLTKRVLMPLKDIGQTATEITDALHQDNLRASQTLTRRIMVPSDAGELRALVVNVNQMLDALALHDARQRQFIADASHELRTPLTVIRGNLELIRRTPSMSLDEVRHLVMTASGESENMAELISDLLSLARLEYVPNEQSNLIPIELDAIVVEVFQIAIERSHSQQSKAVVHLIELEQCQAMGDSNKLKQAILILIDNAFKYAPNSTISIGLKVTDTHAQFIVKDTGKGIPQAELPNIFDRFYRVDKSHSSEGSGLGLSIAKAIVAMHNGVIDVKSSPNTGTEFTISLPLYVKQYDLHEPHELYSL